MNAGKKATLDEVLFISNVNFDFFIRDHLHTFCTVCLCLIRTDNSNDAIKKIFRGKSFLITVNHVLIYMYVIMQGSHSVFKCEEMLILFMMLDMNFKE